MISSENIIFSVYFTRQEFIAIETLSKRERFNSAFFTLTILPNIVGSVSMLRPKIRAHDYWLHIDNDKLHNAAVPFQKTEEMGFTRLSQPPYSYDLAPCDFFLFRYLKKNKRGVISDLKTR
jgi:hypothetical protein